MKNWSLFITGMVAFALAGCAGSHRRHKGKAEPVYYAVAELRPTKGSNTRGRVMFSEAFGSVEIVAEVSGLDPNSKHGFHIHEFGDCTAPDASSAGGHYDPKGHDHGAPQAEVRHVGDLGNLETDGKGGAKLEIKMKNMSINGKLNPIIGRGVIVHKNPDDLVSQPTGGAGARIACGVIGAASR